MFPSCSQMTLCIPCMIILQLYKLEKKIYIFFHSNHKKKCPICFSSLQAKSQNETWEPHIFLLFSDNDLQTDIQTDLQLCRGHKGGTPTMSERRGRPCAFCTSAMTQVDLQLWLRTWRIRIQEMKDAPDVKPGAFGHSEQDYVCPSLRAFLSAPYFKCSCRRLWNVLHLLTLLPLLLQRGQKLREWAAAAAQPACE